MGPAVERRRPAITGTRRALREFVALPALVVLGYGALGVASIALDKAPPGWLMGLHDSLASVISRDAASSVLSAVATSVVTVTSITFSVLLLAVQQNAASMTPAVFDQFLRRKTNQLYLGMFAGLSLYAFLDLSSIGKTSKPAFGASIALLLTIVAFGALVVLIYSTIDQMRPSSVTKVIHDRALAARESEQSILRRTRRRSESDRPIQATVRAERDGFVTGLDLDGVARALAMKRGVEIELEITLGSNVAYGQTLAVARGDDPEECGRVVSACGRAIWLDRERDIDSDAGFAIDELANIAWSTLSSSKQNPSTGRIAIDRLRDLGMRWAEEDPTAADDDVLPVVYDDADVGHLLDTLLSLLVVCAESRQSESAAHLVAALADVVATGPAPSVEAATGAVERVLPTVEEHALTRPLERALVRLADALGHRGCDDTAALVASLLGRTRLRADAHPVEVTT